ncbi:MAG: peptidylprolyl isomerase [Bacteroidales bacterium]|nr:peptidylprolyl isomerase [Bacteroidales bacterium]MBN2763487.1 peptidylprolyl isomerase [Bacteroidales bacterium]
MAVLEKLRTRAGLLLAIIIGMALFAFVLSDLLDSGGSLFTKSKHEIAEIAGKSIPYTEYETKVQDFVEFQQIRSGQSGFDEDLMNRIRMAVWENMMQDLIFEKEYKKTGIEVSEDELKELFIGSNPHQLVVEYFGDPQTRTLNRAGLAQFIQQIQEIDDSDEKTYYAFVENEVYRSRKYEKYLGLLRHGLNATTLEARRRYADNSTTVDFDFLVKPFSTLNDSAVTISNDDIKKYYASHKNNYKQDESRDIRYLYYEIIPSKEDYQDAENYIINNKEAFAKAENTRQFVNLNSTNPYDETNYRYGELPDTLNDIMFSAEVGTLVGPYFEDNAYKLAKLADVNYLPDSVRARHILLQATQNNASRIWQTADSLKDLIVNGADFAALARTYSADNGSAAEGGDLNWFKEGQMVKPFSDSCFFGKTGDVKIVPTQYGIHIIEITDQSKPSKTVQVGILEKEVMPSDATDQFYYSKANEFAGINNTYEKFNKAIEAQNLSVYVRPAKGLKPLDREITGLESPRLLVKWAYEADEKEVSQQVFKFGNKYVIAVLDDIQEEGYASLESIKEEIEHEVRKEKKAEKISNEIRAKITEEKALEDLAVELNLPVKTAVGVRVSYPSLPDVGSEPVIVASALQLEKNVISQPMTGINGVFIVVVNNINKADDPAFDFLQREKTYLDRNYAARVNYAGYEALKDMSRITDNRRQFY